MSKFQIYNSNEKKDDHQEAQPWRWRLIDNNHEIIADGGEGMLTKHNVLASIKTFRNEASSAKIVEDETANDDDKGYRFEIYKTPGESAQPWRWSFKAGNHEKMAKGEGYSSKRNVEEGIRNVQSEVGRATITWKNPNDDPAKDAKTTVTTETDGKVTGS